jgi:hypothetical protein
MYVATVIDGNRLLYSRNWELILCLTPHRVLNMQLVSVYINNSKIDEAIFHISWELMG